MKLEKKHTREEEKCGLKTDSVWVTRQETWQTCSVSAKWGEVNVVKRDGVLSGGKVRSVGSGGSAGADCTRVDKAVLEIAQQKTAKIQISIIIKSVINAKAFIEGDRLAHGSDMYSTSETQTHTHTKTSTKQSASIYAQAVQKEKQQNELEFRK